MGDHKTCEHCNDLDKQEITACNRRQTREGASERGKIGIGSNYHRLRGIVARAIYTNRKARYNKRKENKLVRRMKTTLPDNNQPYFLSSKHKKERNLATFKTWKQIWV